MHPFASHARLLDSAAQKPMPLRICMRSDKQTMITPQFCPSGAPCKDAFISEETCAAPRQEHFLAEEEESPHGKIVYATHQSEAAYTPVDKRKALVAQYCSCLPSGFALPLWMGKW